MSMQVFATIHKIGDPAPEGEKVCIFEVDLKVDKAFVQRASDNEIIVINLSKYRIISDMRVQPIQQGRVLHH